jgi:frataxin-like iron-binding protein CyaY
MEPKTMTVQTVDVSDFVNVSVNITPLAIPFANFGLPVFIGDSNVIDINQRYRSYTTIIGVGQDFGNTSPEYLAAEIFFSQQPQPAQLFLGRWARTATAGLLHGAVLTAAQQLLANFTVITSGAFFITIDGVPQAISGLNFSAALNLNGVASLIQTALPAGDLCVFGASKRFDIVSSTTGIASSVSFGAAPTAIGDAVFSANPANNDTLTIGGTTVTFVTGTPTGNQVLIGGTLAITLASLVNFLNASADVNIVKANYSVVASTLYVVFKTAGVTGNSFTLAKVSTAIALSAATLAGGSGTDISTLLGLTSASGASPLVHGIAAESPLSAVTAMANTSSQWYGVMFACATFPADADYEAVAAYILASSRTRILGITEQNTNLLDPTQTNDLASVLQTFNNKRVFVMWSSTNAFAAATIFGRALTVNFNGNLTTITLAYKQAPGIIGENLTETQFATLVSKGANTVINVDNGATMIWPGQMSNGYFFDEVHGTDWFQNRVQTDVFNLLYTTTTKVPQTDAGNNMIATAMVGSCEAAINNGFAAAGQWNAAGFGSLQQGDALTKGYYIYYPPIATQSESDRTLRISVVFQIALKLAGAVQTPFVVININR